MSFSLVKSLSIGETEDMRISVDPHKPHRRLVYGGDFEEREYSFGRALLTLFTYSGKQKISFTCFYVLILSVV